MQAGAEEENVSDSGGTRKVMAHPLFVSTSWLKEALEDAGKVKVLEVSWLSTDRQNFIEEHVPGARFCDMTQGMVVSKLIPMNIQQPRDLQLILQEAGVNIGDHVVVYDRYFGVWASKVWWLLRAHGHPHVSLLDGTWTKWKADDLPTEAGEPGQPKPGNFEAGELNPSMLKSFDDMVRISRDKSMQVIDVRNAEDFQGIVEEPTEFSLMSFSLTGQEYPTDMHKGHMPGALNMPMFSILDPDTNCFLPNDKLKQVFESHGIAVDQPTVTSCYAGFTANLNAISLHALGNTSVALYQGSWAEYGQRASPDDVTKEAQ